MILTALLLTLATPACQKYDTALPRALAGWTRAGREFDTGHTLTLRQRRGAVQTSVRIRKAGTYGIALDQPGWVEIRSARGRTLRSVADARGPRCSTIRKIVRYRLEPGTYRVAASRLKGDRARMMLVRY